VQVLGGRRSQVAGTRKWDSESVRAKQTHCGLKFRFVPAATTCAKASRQLVEGSIEHIAYEARGATDHRLAIGATRNFRTEVGSSVSHTAASRRPALGSGGAPVGGFWPRICVVKKGHARDIYFLLQTRSFWHFSASAPPLLSCLSLRAAIYSPVPFIGCIGSFHIKHRSGRSADLKSLRWYRYSIGHLAGVSYMRIVHRVTQGKIFRFCT
jgi:hypothetical protein